MTREFKTISEYELLRMARRSLEQRLSEARVWANYYAYEVKDSKKEAFHTQRAFELHDQIEEISAAMWALRRERMEARA